LLGDPRANTVAAKLGLFFRFCFGHFRCFMSRAGLRGGGPGTPLQGAPMMKCICFKQSTRLKNFCDSEAIQEYNSILYSYVALSISGSNSN